MPPFPRTTSQLNQEGRQHHGSHSAQSMVGGSHNRTLTLSPHGRTTTSPIQVPGAPGSGGRGLGGSRSASVAMFHRHKFRHPMKSHPKRVSSFAVRFQHPASTPLTEPTCQMPLSTVLSTLPSWISTHDGAKTDYDSNVIGDEGIFVLRRPIGRPG
jgi:hypothetical protein